MIIFTEVSQIYKATQSSSSQLEHNPTWVLISLIHVGPPPVASLLLPSTPSLHWPLNPGTADSLCHKRSSSRYVVHLIHFLTSQRVGL